MLNIINVYHGSKVLTFDKPFTVGIMSVIFSNWSITDNSPRIRQHLPGLITGGYTCDSGRSKVDNDQCPDKMIPMLNTHDLHD